ncbi:hypothetical protein [Nonomuraea sp. NPDC049784]|uniref:GP88 family protein n=1 Tax=Nonomuraea sp. NPDC049784 TaxID=3154361 RepID=UPI0033F0FA4E
MTGPANDDQFTFFDELPGQRAAARPRRLLTQNGQLRREGIWNWTLPALSAELPSGRTVVTCPSADACADICYARFGAYRFSNVLARHVANLAFVVEDLDGWEKAMRTELGSRRFHDRWIRIHDSGDWFSDAYVLAWLRIISDRPGVRFYTYTKEVARFRRLVEPQPPPNLLWVYSLGGKHDRALDATVDRVADVFPDEAAIAEANWHSQAESDLLAVLGPSPVGMAAIVAALRRQGNRTLSQMQKESDLRRQQRRTSQKEPLAS